MKIEKNNPMAEADAKAPNDIPINKMCFYSGLAVVGAFCFFQLSSCTSSWLTTPAYVQAIEACNQMTVIPVTVQNPGSTPNQKFDITISASQDVLATLEKCHQNVRDNFLNGQKPIIPNFTPSTLGGNLRELLDSNK